MGTTDIWNLRFFMHRTTHTMAHQFTHNPQTMFFTVRLNRPRNIPYAIPFNRLFNSLI